MHNLFRLFKPRRRANQDEIAGRAAEIFVQVLFDVGVDRFLGGTVLLDREFRLSFYTVPPRAARHILCSIPVADLPGAHTFHVHMRELGLEAPAVLLHIRMLVEDLMQELRVRSPAVCALAPGRVRKGPGERAG
jgi:hypothetical protein